jgi:hypothetical protein
MRLLQQVPIRIGRPEQTVKMFNAIEGFSFFLSMTAALAESLGRQNGPLTNGPKRKYIKKLFLIHFHADESGSNSFF